MSKWRKWLMLAAFALLIPALTAILSHVSEPTYQGRSYNDWLAQADWEMREHDGDEDPDTEGFRALREIGTNAVPILLKWVKHRPEPWRDRLNSLVQKLPPRIQQNASIQRLLRDPYPGVRRYNVELAFSLLGTNASFAVPELTRLMHDPAADRDGFAAAIALAYIGPAGLPPLLAAAADPKAQCQYWAYHAIDDMGSNALPAIPFLIQSLKNTNPVIASLAAQSLGFLRFQPELVLPALTNALPVISPHSQAYVCIWLYELPAHRPLARQAFASAWKKLDANERRSIEWLILQTLPEEAKELLSEKPAPE